MGNEAVNGGPAARCVDSPSSRVLASALLSLPSPSTMDGPGAAAAIQVVSFQEAAARTGSLA